jgi:hypothetical protein
MIRAAIVIALAACSGAGTSGETATFRVFYPDMANAGFHASVGKHFAVKPVGQCLYTSGRDARWSMTGARVDSGKLPPGLAIEEGAVSGTPIEAGSWTFQVKFSGVTCAGKPHDAQLVDVTITVAAGKR